MSNITNELVVAYLNSFYKNENPQLIELRRFAEEKHVPIVLRETEQLLMGILKMRGAKNVLEIGTAIGYSACCMADCWDCEVTTIESDKEAYESAVSNISALGFKDRIEVKFGDARQVMLEMADQRKYAGRFDMVFIDAAKSHYKAFWDLALPLCRDDALIVCDNVLMKGMTASDSYDKRRRYKTSIMRMREFLEYISSLKYAATCILPVGDGVSISVINKSGDAYRDALMQ